MTFSVPSLNRLPAAERGITLADFLVPVRIAERMRPFARHLALVVAGAILVALAAQVRFPVPGSPVPVTGQTFAVLLVGGALGARRAGLATGLYLALGLFLPVYAGGQSGLDTFATRQDGAIILGATGGYLVGFIVAAMVVGKLAELGWDRHLGGAIAAMAVGNAIIYAVGLPWLWIAADLTFSQTISQGLAPFLVGDLVKLALAGAVFPFAWWVVERSPQER